VYDRRYDGRELMFEASGGLLNAALVMRDRPTNSWWSIMTGDAIGGELQGTSLREIAQSEKTQWGEWRRRYPATKVWSVAGKQDVDSNPYDNYLSSSETFRGATTGDKRLPDKESIYAFKMDDVTYAVPHSAVFGGAVFQLESGKEIFLYRKPESQIYASTYAYVSEYRGDKSRFVRKDGQWLDSRSRARFSESSGFTGASDASSDSLVHLTGFDTFWYIWSATHEGVTILGK
jgi:hypothetical protein